MFRSTTATRQTSLNRSYANRSTNSNHVQSSARDTKAPFLQRVGGVAGSAKQNKKTPETKRFYSNLLVSESSSVSTFEALFPNEPITTGREKQQFVESTRIFSSDLMERERDLELKAVQQAHEKYVQTAEMVTEVKSAAQMPSGKDLILTWYDKVLKPIKQVQETARKNTKSPMYEKHLARLPADKIALLSLHTVLSYTLISSQETRDIAIAIGEAIQAQINAEGIDKLPEMRRKKLNGSVAPFRINSMAMRMLKDPIDWPMETLISLGSILLQIIISNTSVPVKHSPGTMDVPAFDYLTQPFTSSTVSASVALRNYVEEHNDLVGQLNPKHQPMIVPPREWTSFKNGGYHFLSNRVMRTRGSGIQVEVLKNAIMPEVLSALNALGTTSWRINSKVLRVMEECWEEGISIGDLPPRFGDLELPPLYQENYIASRSREYSKALQHNRDLNSLRCDWLLKLKVARDFENEKFYFPHNIDFRGRAYPIPPHLNHVGSDLCRGLLEFDEARPLGSNGLRWLKVHVANLYGQDKLSFDGRVAWFDKNIDNILDSARNPLKGSRWWTEADEPFECLAACFELEEILRSENPEQYLSRIPVQMDGSCNGLQHYAALGRDEHGAEHVNLLDSEKPMDVYLRVREVVIKHLEEAAKAGDKLPQYLLGNVERSTIKQTVMTSVYGVTFIGARSQIQRRLKEMNLSEEMQFQGAGYLAQLTLKSLGEVFSGAYSIMDWLNTCAHLISGAGYPVMWVTPLGLPVVQPYRNQTNSVYSVRTILQKINLARNGDDLPVNVSRQRSAFPPNYVHSIDATHMFMTANECCKQKLQFAAVHDSFWTHASDVDKMNGIIREKFVELHSQPLLETLLESFKRRYPDIEFPDVPRRGTLDLKHVLDSKYFFD